MASKGVAFKPPYASSNVLDPFRTPTKELVIEPMFLSESYYLNTNGFATFFTYTVPKGKTLFINSLSYSHHFRTTPAFDVNFGIQATKVLGNQNSGSGTWYNNVKLLTFYKPTTSTMSGLYQLSSSVKVLVAEGGTVYFVGGCGDCTCAVGGFLIDNTIDYRQFLV